MGVIKVFQDLFNIKPKASAYLQMVDPSAGLLATIDEFSIAPKLTGREAVLIYDRMFDTDSHLEGLYRRINIAILSSQIEITCEDEDVAEFVRNAMGIVAGQPPARFLRTCNEFVSALQYGFSLHEKIMDNDDDGSKIKLRRIEPVDVHEFIVQNDDLVKVAETYQEHIHGVDVETRKMKTKSGQEVEVVDLDAENLIHVAPLQLGRNYWGRSIFRAAVGGWAYKVILQFCDAIRQGRISVPFIIGKLDKFSERNLEDVDVLQKVLTLPATAINRIIIARKEDEFEMLSPSQSSELLDRLKAIDFSHSKLVLEQFVDVGDKAWGSRSTYTAGSDDFYDSLNFYEMCVLAGVHEYATAIADANFTDHPPMHTLFKEMGIARQRIAEVWNDMVGAGTVRRGKDDEPHFRKKFGMPDYAEPEEGDLSEVQPGSTGMGEETEDVDMPPGTTTNGAPAPTMEVT